MFLRKYWAVFIFYLTCQTPIVLAKSTTSAATVDDNKVIHLILLREGYPQLIVCWRQDSMISCLCKHFHEQKTRPSTHFLPHQGIQISLIQLHKNGALCSPTLRKRGLVGYLLPTTRDQIILAQLHLSPVDKILPQQFESVLTRLDFYSCIKEAQIVAHKRADSNDTVDIRTIAKYRFSTRFGWDPRPPSLCIDHRHLWGRGHVLRNQFFYDRGLGYRAVYRTSRKYREGITGEFQYLVTPRKSTKQVSVFKDFSDTSKYAGKLTISKLRRNRPRVLDGHWVPLPTLFSVYCQSLWSGILFQGRPKKAYQCCSFFLTGKIIQKRFINRPPVTLGMNRYFHNYTFGLGGIGFFSKKNRQEQLVYELDRTEEIALGSKVGLVVGYQTGEFVSRPYLGWDMVQSSYIPTLGYLHGIVKIGGFIHEGAIEQGIMQWQLDYFTPLLRIGRQQIRQFVRLDYLSGHRMFTGEFISTNTHRVGKAFRDPFPGGTRRLRVGLETVLSTPVYFASCGLAALCFADIVVLRGAYGESYQHSLCKVLGVGLRCMNPRWASGAWQVKLGYYPLVDRIGLEISNNLMHRASKKLAVHGPETISFREY